MQERAQPPENFDRKRRNILFQRHRSPKFRRQLRELGYPTNHLQMAAIMKGELDVDSAGNIVRTSVPPSPAVNAAIRALPPSKTDDLPRVGVTEPEPVTPAVTPYVLDIPARDTQPVTPASQPETMTIDDAAETLNVTPRTVAWYAHSGRLQLVTVDDQEAITVESVTAYMVTRKASTRDARAKAWAKRRAKAPMPIAAPVAVVASSPDHEIEQLRGALFNFVDAFSGATAEAGTDGQLHIAVSPRQSTALFIAWGHAVDVLGLNGK